MSDRNHQHHQHHSDRDQLHWVKPVKCIRSIRSIETDQGFQTDERRVFWYRKQLRHHPEPRNSEQYGQDAAIAFPFQLSKYTDVFK